MKELLNKVVESKKAAEANLSHPAGGETPRQTPIAAMGSQAHTTRLLADNPTLMCLRELEVLEEGGRRRPAAGDLRREGIAGKVM